MKKTIRILSLAILFLISSVSVNAQGLKIGDTASAFALRNVNGSNVDLLKAMGTKGAIVVFTCNHCPFSKAYEERIMDLDKNFRDQGYPVIAINPNDPSISPEDSFEKMQERAKERGYSFPYLFDEKQEVAKAFGATRTPHVYLLNLENGSPVVEYIGSIDDNADEPKDVKEKFLENALKQLIAGQKVALQETKAIGCTIKWQK